MKESSARMKLANDPLYGPAVREAARVNRVGGLTRGESPADINVMAIAIARMANELDMLRQATTRIIDHSDPDSCNHNRRVDPDTGECLDCGTVLP